MAVGIGLLLALAVGLLVVQGILAPVFTRIFGLEREGPATLPLALLVFAAAFSFYFGGMAASYKAPFRHRLHGVLIVPVAFVLSSALNLALGKGFLPGVDGPWALGLVIVFLVASTAASYLGAHRGEAIFSSGFDASGLARTRVVGLEVTAVTEPAATDAPIPA